MKPYNAPWNASIIPCNYRNPHTNMHLYDWPVYRLIAISCSLHFSTDDGCIANNKGIQGTEMCLRAGIYLFYYCHPLKLGCIHTNMPEIVYITITIY